MTNGNEWGEPAHLLEKVGIVYWGLFVFYIFFTFFSVINVITGHFVDNAIQNANNNRVLRDVKTKQKRQHLGNTLNTILQEVDADNSGSIGWAEWTTAPRDDRVVQAL